MRAIGIAIVGIAFVTGPVRADDDASVKIIKKAIAAHGGADNLRKAQSFRGTDSSVMYRGGTITTSEAEYVARLPDYEKVTMQIAGFPNKIVRIVAKDKFYMQEGTQFVELDSKVQAIKKAALQRAYVGTLVPVLTDKAYTVSLVDEQIVGARKATGVRVQKGKELDVILYLDNASGLLVKQSYQGYDLDNQRWVSEEIVYSNHKAMDGVMRPMTREIYQDGKLFIKSTVRELKHVQDIKDSEFAKP